MEEERTERQRWNEREQEKIMDSVRGKDRINVFCVVLYIFSIGPSVYS